MPARWWPSLLDVQPRRYAPLTPTLLEQSGRDLPLQRGDLAYDGDLAQPIADDATATLRYPTGLLFTLPQTNEASSSGRVPIFGAARLRRSRAYVLTRVIHARYLRWESDLRDRDQDRVGGTLRVVRQVLGTVCAVLGICALGISTAARWLAPRAWMVVHPLVLTAVARGRATGDALARNASALGRRAVNAGVGFASLHRSGIRRAGSTALVVGALAGSAALFWPLARRVPVIGPVTRGMRGDTVAEAIVVGALLIWALRVRRSRRRTPEAREWRQAKQASLAQARAHRFRGLSGGAIAGLPLLPAAYGAWSSLSRAGWTSTLSLGQAITVATHLVVGYVIALAVLGIFVSPAVRRGRRRRYRRALLGLRSMSAALIMTIGLAGAVALTVALPIASSHASP